MAIPFMFHCFVLLCYIFNRSADAPPSTCDSDEDCIVKGSRRRTLHTFCCHQQNTEIFFLTGKCAYKHEKYLCDRSFTRATWCTSDKECRIFETCAYNQCQSGERGIPCMTENGHRRSCLPAHSCLREIVACSIVIAVIFLRSDDDRRYSVSFFEMFSNYNQN